MSNALLFDFIVDKTQKSICVKREFAAGIDVVWEAWTNPEILDLWWAPKPWKSVTKSMEFKEGGYRLYAMVGPNNEQHWGKQYFTNIVVQQSFAGKDVFCDDAGNTNTELPAVSFENVFTANANKTLVTIRSTYESAAAVEQIIAMGFKEGFTMALENLDQYIQAQQQLRMALKTNQQPRVCTYLNFPGNTEAAFTFYKMVFKSEFSGAGIQKFGDIPVGEGFPPVADAVKNMVLHVELPITGHHVLMATDAPTEMGFTVTQGNNMHISVEPESREEADRIFNALADGGTITMPMADMFFGAYFGSLTDQFGINWMINYKNPA